MREPQADIAIPSQKGLHPPPLPKTVLASLVPLSLPKKNGAFPTVV